MEKLVSRSLMLILIGMATAQNIQAGERMSMPTSFKKQTTGLSHVSQQTISVKGNVRDQSGEPMAGVNVIVEGTTIGTMTDSNGNFTLNVPSTSIKIKFSYIGYEDQIVLIKNNRNLNRIPKCWTKSRLLDMEHKRKLQSRGLYLPLELKIF